MKSIRVIVDAVVAALQSGLAQRDTRRQARGVADLKAATAAVAAAAAPAAPAEAGAAGPAGTPEIGIGHVATKITERIARACADAGMLASAFAAYYRNSDDSELNAYSERCLKRVWRAVRF